MPAPDAVFVFIKMSSKIFYNRFRVIRVLKPELKMRPCLLYLASRLHFTLVWFNSGFLRTQETCDTWQVKRAFCLKYVIQFSESELLPLASSFGWTERNINHRAFSK